MKLFRLDADYNVVPEKDTIMLIMEFKSLWSMKYNAVSGDNDGGIRREELQRCSIYTSSVITVQSLVNLPGQKERRQP